MYVAGLLLLLAAHGRVALREADYFRYRGQSVQTMLETVEELSGDGANVLSCFRPNEEGNLTINYWMLDHGYDNVYFWTQEDRHWCYTPTLDLSEFTEMKCGTLTIYVRNGSGLNPAAIDIEGLRINF